MICFHFIETFWLKYLNAYSFYTLSNMNDWIERFTQKRRRNIPNFLRFELNFPLFISRTSTVQFLLDRRISLSVYIYHQDDIYMNYFVFVLLSAKDYKWMLFIWSILLNWIKIVRYYGREIFVEMRIKYEKC